MVTLFNLPADETKDEVYHGEQLILSTLHDCSETLKDQMIQIAQMVSLLFESQGIDNLGLYYLSLIQKTLANISAFETLINAKNYPTSLALSRMQLDIYLKINAILFVEDPEYFAQYVLEDKPLHLFRDKNFTKGMKDTELCKRIDKIQKNNWVSQKYSETSKYIHPSRRDAEHILKGVTALEGSDLQKYTYVIERNGYLLISIGDLLKICQEFILIGDEIRSSLLKTSDYLRNGYLKELRQKDQLKNANQK